MNKTNFLSGRDKELYEMAKQFELAQNEGTHFYMDADDWADLADWYATHKKGALAFKATKTGLSQHPGNTAILVEQAYLYLDNGQMETASFIADSIEENHLAEVKILNATLYLRKGEDWKANEILESLEDKDSLANIVEIAYMYIEAGAPDLAQPWLEAGKKRYMNKEAFVAALADYYFNTINIEEAKKAYNQLLDINPYSAPYWFGLSRCYIEEELFDKAVEAAEFAIVADEEFGEAYLVLTNAYYMLGNEEKGMECYEKALQLNAIPEDLIETFDCLIQTETGQWEEALTNFEKLLEKKDLSTIEGKKQSAIIYSSMAQCQQNLGRMKEAHELCQKAFELNLNIPEPYITKGTLLILEGNYEEGISMWNKATNLSNEIPTWWLVGSQAIELGLIEVAKQCFEAIAQEKPDFPKLNEQLSLLYLLSNDMEKFQEYNQRCQTPITPEAMKNIQQSLADSKQEEFADLVKKIFNSL